MSTLDEEPIFDVGQIVSELRRCACSGRTRSFEWRLYHYICLLETLECLNANGLLSQFIIVMTCICAKLVSVSHANHFIKSHRIYYCDFLVIYLQTMSLNSLKIMKNLQLLNIEIYHNWRQFRFLYVKLFLSRAVCNLVAYAQNVEERERESLRERLGTSGMRRIGEVGLEMRRI